MTILGVSDKSGHDEADNGDSEADVEEPVKLPAKKNRLSAAKKATKPAAVEDDIESDEAPAAKSPQKRKRAAPKKQPHAADDDDEEPAQAPVKGKKQGIQSPSKRKPVDDISDASSPAQPRRGAARQAAKGGYI